MTTRTNKQPTIALCVIAKNEEEFIGECLDSARPFVGEIVVVDTGSTDRTVELARQRGARVVDFAWIDDFAAARNAGLDAATADWILVLDADERLTPESGPVLRTAAAQMPPNFDGFCVQIESHGGGNRTVAHYVTRLFPRRSDLRFAGAVHEELTSRVVTSGSRFLTLPEVRIIHLGYEPELYARRGKDERNVRLLEQELAKHPNSARILFYLVKQHCAGGRPAQALPYSERFMANKDQMPHAFEVEVFRMWLEALLVLGRLEDVWAVKDAARKAGALSADAYEMLGHYELARGNTRAALDEYVLALDPTLPVGPWARPTGKSWELGLKVAELRWRLGEHKRALKQFEQVFPELPEDRRRAVALAIVKLCIEAQHFSAAHTWAARVRQHTPDDLRAHLELLDLELAMPADSLRVGPFAALDRALCLSDWQAAYDAAIRLPLVDLAGVARLVRLAARLIDEGAPDAAVDLLERVVDVQSAEPLVYRQLVRALTALDRHEDAANALALLEAFGAAETQTRAA